MPTPVQNLLNPSIGIADLMSMPETPSLPMAKEMPTSVLQKSGLENLYVTNNARSHAEALLCPDVGDGTAVTPEIFQERLLELLAKLKKSQNPKLQTLLKEEIEPLLQNGLLLSAYRNLMLGG